MYVQIVWAVILGIALQGCTLAPKQELPPSREDEFFSLGVEHQVRRFREYSLSEQFRLVVIGNQRLEPPAIYLYKEFARNGEVILPLLRDELSRTDDEATIRDVVAVLLELKRNHVLFASVDPDFSALLRAKVSAMTGVWKSTVQRMLAALDESGA